MWEYGGIRLLLASNQPLPIDRSIPARLTAEALDDLAAEGVAGAEAFLALFTLVDEDLRAEIGSGPVITDDRPLNEYFNLLRIQNLWTLLPEETAAYESEGAARPPATP